jgi:D-glucosaminate-6-phosphate ammonia-lyase
MKRRQFLIRTGWLSLLGGLLPSRFLSPAYGQTPAPPASRDPAPGSFYARLKVKPVINAVGSVTYLGGSIMAPETLAAMDDASREFVVITELLERSGEHLAQLLGVEAALVTTGAAGAITLGTAACVAGSDLEKIQRLPDTTGLKREVILQKSHRNEYETQLRLVGTQLIEVETRAQLEAAINERTAMLFFMNKADPFGQIHRDEWVEAGRKHRIPTFLDAAADTPPREHLSSYAKMGFDLVAFSGGKSLRGPQPTGLLVGRKDLVDAARHNTSPYDRTIGRAMKVGKEEIAGLVTAVERFLNTDHEAEYRQLESRIHRIGEALAGLAAVRTELWVPEIANHVPHLIVTWDPARLPLSSATVYQRLLDGDPRVAVRERAPHSVIVSALMLRPEQDAVVADRLRAVLSLQ